MQYKAIRKTPTYVRSFGETAQGWLDPGDVVDVKRVQNGRGYFEVESVGTNVLCGALWVAMSDLEQVVTPPPQPPQPPQPVRRHRIGVHIINDHRQAQVAYDLGARVFTWMDGKVGAVQFAQGHPDATVIYRRYINQARPSPDDLLRAIEYNPIDPNNVWYVGLNESDSIGTSADEIRWRAKLDNEVALRIQRANPNHVYIAGSFGHGNPDTTSADVMRAMREGYAAGYNAGLYRFDIHNYTKGKRFPHHPVAESPIFGPEWFETRALKLAEAGFDMNRVGGLVSTEGGVEAKAGGFNWADYTEAQFSEWLTWYQALMDQHQQYDFTTLYQFGENRNWAGYDIRRYSAVLRNHWQTARALSLAPAYTTPPMKVHQ